MIPASMTSTWCSRNRSSNPIRIRTWGAPGEAASPSPRKAPRTSEIFRTAVAPGDGAVPPDGMPDGAAGDQEGADLGVVNTAGPAAPCSMGEGPADVAVPWGQILLLSYSSILTLALIWLIATGRMPARDAAAEPPPVEAPAVEASPNVARPAVVPSTPPIPNENVTTPGRPLVLGDLEVTPLSVEAGSVELIRAIDPDARRHEDDCLILRLRLVNRSSDRTFKPLDRILIRERDTGPFDPYINTAEGRLIHLFPLAPDSEWSILGQSFPELRPGESAETCVIAEPGSAGQLAGEMTWRLRLRTGVYRTDMLGVKFEGAEVGQSDLESFDDEE